MVDGVQAHSPGPDEATDALQFSCAHVVVEEDFVGEVDAADGLEGGGGGRPGAVLGPVLFGCAVLCDAAAVIDGLRDGILQVLHLLRK